MSYDQTKTKTAEYDGSPLHVMSFDTLMKQGKSGGMAYYVWPNEGEWKGGTFVFHKGSYDDNGVTIEYPTKPLLVDASSAKAFVLVAEAINEKNRGKLVQFTEEHRGLFCGLVMDRLVWPHVSFGG